LAFSHRNLPLHIWSLREVVILATSSLIAALPQTDQGGLPVNWFFWIETTQTAALLTVSGALIYALLLLRREIKNGIATLLELLRSQREMERRIERLWVRIDEMEQRERERDRR
jgi:hypothetical protein